MTTKQFGWTFGITSFGWFLFALDRLVVVTALPQIGTDLGAGLSGMEWTVNAYSLAVVALLLTGAALGDRFGRRRMFVVGLAVFTAGSAGAAMAPTVAALAAARAIQGAGGAIFVPLAMTILSAASPPARRGTVLGLWGAIGGLGAAAGPLVGGGLTTLAGWPWIFWLNVPIGIVVMVLASVRLTESRGPRVRLDLPGVALGSAALLGLGWGLVRTSSVGVTNPEVLLALTGGVLALITLVRWEMHTVAPMMPMRFFRSRTFAAANAAALVKYAALFGALFLLAQLLQTGLGATPVQAGLQMLPMAVMPMLLAPVGGILADWLGPRPLLVIGVGMVTVGLAWLAAVVGPGVGYQVLIPGFLLAGAGSAVFFAPLAATVLGAVAPQEQGQASGVAASIRELGAVIGIAVLASVFAANGDFVAPTGFVAGIVPALWTAVALGATGVLFALLLPPLGSGSSKVQDRNAARPVTQTPVEHCTAVV